MLLCAVATLALSGCDPASRFGPLAKDWSARTGHAIASKPAVGYGKVFIGSWDGYEYAFDEASGALRWKTGLGIHEDYCPQYDALGVTSSPALRDGVAYLGGGDGNWHALDVETGSKLWALPTEGASPSSGHYNWSSPVIHNGYEYFGIASHCDSPLVQGRLVRVDLASRRVANVWKVVPDGQVGGTIWTSPVIDGARNTVFVTTGNQAYDSTGATQQYAEALVALDATTLAVKGSWSLPAADPTPDADFSTSPTLFRDASGRDLVAAANKNGVLYAFRRDDVSAGPVWSTRLAQGAVGADPAAGAVYSNGYFDAGRGLLYYASGRTTVAGATVAGAIRAIDPRTGAFVWERALPSGVYGALTGANGMVVVPAISALHLVDADDGQVVYGNDLGASLYGAATVAGGRLFVGDTVGVVHALRYPAEPSALAAAAGMRSADGAGRCGLTAGEAPVTVACRIALSRRCTELGTTELAAGARAIRRVVVRPVGVRRTAHAIVRLHMARGCAGTPSRRVTLERRGATVLTLGGRRRIAAGTAFSAVASERVRLRVRIERR